MEREVVCSFCKHKQKTKSKLKRITCSSCQGKFINPDYINRNPKPDHKIKSSTKVSKVKLE